MINKAYVYAGHSADDHFYKTKLFSWDLERSSGISVRNGCFLHSWMPKIAVSTKKLLEAICRSYL